MQVPGHAVHASIVRGLTGGAAGLRAEDGNRPAGDERWWRGYREKLARAAREAGKD